jgi:hypothetical protein
MSLSASKVVELAHVLEFAPCLSKFDASKRATIEHRTIAILDMSAKMARNRQLF